MIPFYGQAIIFLCFFIVAIILSIPSLKDAHKYAQEKKNEREEYRKRKAIIAGKEYIGRTAKFRQRLLYNLDIVRMPKQVFFVLEIGSAILGLFFGRLILSSLELVICMAAVTACLPIVFVAVRASWYRQHEAAILESCMVMITGSYRANRDIIKAIKDNIDKPNMPVAFRNFLSEVTFVDSSVERALRRVAASFNNRYFDEWIEVLIKAQHDSTMMDILPVIVDEMNEAKKAQNESAAAMKAVWREYVIWVITVVCVPLILKLNNEWYTALVYTLPGKAMVLGLLLGLVNTLRVMVKISRPLDL